MLNNLLRALSNITYRQRWAVIGFWGLLLVVASLGSSHLEPLLQGGSGAIEGSQSLRVDERLYRDFDNPFTKAIEISFRGDTVTLESPAFEGLVRETNETLKKTPGVRRTLCYFPTKDQNLRSQDLRSTAILAGLQASSVEQEEKLLPSIRQALAPLKEKAAKLGIQMATTGRSAITSDVNRFSSEDSTRAEIRALPLTLLVLLLAFGSLVAAGLPLLMGVASTTVTLGLVFLIAHGMALSNMTQNIATMLGLAVGIDYSLLIVNRFREARKAKEIAEAIEETMTTAGKAVLYSGATVMIGLWGLLFTPLFETRSVGIGGTLVVIVSVLAALTLIPALLSVAGQHIDWPLKRELNRHEERWRRWAHLVLARPFVSILVALVLLGLLIIPIQKTVTGFPSAKMLPARMESRIGYDILSTMNQGWSIFPIYVIAEAAKEDQLDQAPILPQKLGRLIKLSRKLHEEPEVKLVYSPVDLQDGLSPLAYLMLYSNLPSALQKFPMIEELFLSHDKKAALFQVIVKDETTLDQAKALVKRMNSYDVGLKLDVGGQFTYYNDYDEAMNKCFPLVVGFVLLATFLVLMAAYRSLLIPLKAILMNLLSVGAGYGAMVFVFILGWGKQFVGLSSPMEAIPQAVFLIIFCVVFGLSMDYEVFLLSRIKEAYDETGDNNRATAEGLASTGGIITSAALIMVVVFGAFAWAEIFIIKMLGFGLAIAVLVDATVIRCLAVPAFMRIAGKWNWFPGDRRRESKEKAEEPLSV